MSVIFLDSSALVKLYITERGSASLHNFLVGQRVAISQLAIYEAANVIRQRHVLGQFSLDDATDLIGQLRRNTNNYVVIPLGSSDELPSLVDLIFKLPHTLRIRTLDSIQLNAALLAKEALADLEPPAPFIFVSSDEQLLKVAQAQGLTTDNPEDYA